MVLVFITVPLFVLKHLECCHSIVHQHILVVIGGYFHGLRDVSYGVDLDRIRWCGVLQVFLIYPALLWWIVFEHGLRNEHYHVANLYAENSTGLLCSCPLWDLGTSQTSRCFKWQVCDLQNLLHSLVSAVLPKSNWLNQYRCPDCFIWNYAMTYICVLLSCHLVCWYVY